jgi:hypothetical protein
MLRTVLLERRGIAFSDRGKEAVVLDGHGCVDVVDVGFDRGSDHPLHIRPERSRIRDWMCEYMTSSRLYERATFADVFQVGEWSAIFVGDAATDVFVVCFAIVEIWPVQMKARLKVKASCICAVRLLWVSSITSHGGILRRQY